MVRRWGCACVLASLLAGCGSEADAPLGGGLIERILAPGPPTLEIQRHDVDGTEGAYEHNGMRVGFSVYRAGAARGLTLLSRSGEELVRITVQEGVAETRLLDGQVVVRRNALGVVDVAGDLSAVPRLLMRPELPAVTGLSQALAARGLDGRSSEPMFWLHKLLMSTVGNGPGSPLMASPFLPESASTAQCVDVRSDPYHNSCVGMCGGGCICWAWVCGDCCVHAGCVHHDDACRHCSARAPDENCLKCADFSPFLDGTCG